MEIRAPLDLHGLLAEAVRPENGDNKPPNSATTILTRSQSSAATFPTW